MSTHTLSQLLHLAYGRPTVETTANASRRWQLVVGSLLLSLGLCALWGLAAGSSDPALAVGDVIKVPLVVLLSGLAALPAGLLALKLSGVPYRGTDLTESFASGQLGGSLVLATCAPLVALYLHTSFVIGSNLALGSAFVALLVGALVFGRNVIRRAPAGTKRFLALLPAAVLIAMQLLTILQLIALASPILPHGTAFEGGIDKLLIGP